MSDGRRVVAAGRLYLDTSGEEPAYRCEVEVEDCGRVAGALLRVPKRVAEQSRVGTKFVRGVQLFTVFDQLLRNERGASNPE